MKYERKTTEYGLKNNENSHLGLLNLCNSKHFLLYLLITRIISSFFVSRVFMLKAIGKHVPSNYWRASQNSVQLAVIYFIVSCLEEKIKAKLVTSYSVRVKRVYEYPEIVYIFMQLEQNKRVFSRYNPLFLIICNKKSICK